MPGNPVKIQGQQQCPAAHTCRGQRCFTAGMPRAYYNNIICIFWSIVWGAAAGEGGGGGRAAATADIAAAAFC